MRCCGLDEYVLLASPQTQEGLQRGARLSVVLLKELCFQIREIAHVACLQFFSSLSRGKEVAGRRRGLQGKRRELGPY